MERYVSTQPKADRMIKCVTWFTVEWNISDITMIWNTAFLPGKRSFAREYAAMDANKRLPTVPQMVMNTVLNM
jgi:hypothetical protein